MERVVPVRMMLVSSPCLYLFPPGSRQLSQYSLKPEVEWLNWGCPSLQKEKEEGKPIFCTSQCVSLWGLTLVLLLSVAMASCGPRSEASN